MNCLLATVSGWTVNSDESMLGRLRAVWEQTDPVPEQLVDRVLFAPQLEDLEYELLRLTEITEPAGVRGETVITTVTFSTKSLAVMLMLPATHEPVRRIDGWLTPAAPLTVEARTSAGRLQTVAGDDGRFSFPSVPPGSFQLVIYPGAGARPLVAPAVAL